MHSPGPHIPYWMNVKNLCLLKYGYLIDRVKTIQLWNCIYADSKIVLVFKVGSGSLSEMYCIVHRLSRRGIVRDTQKYDAG